MLYKKLEYSPSDFEKSQLKMINARIEKMKRKKGEYEQDWNEADKQRMMHRKQRPKDEWRSDLKLPDTFAIIETAKSEMVDKSPGIIYRPRESGDIEKSEKLNKIFEYTWEKGRGDLELIKFIDDDLVYGLAIGEEYWRQDIRDEKNIEDFDLEKFQPVKWSKKEVTEFDDVYFQSIPVWNIYWDPMGDSLETCRDVVKRLTMPYEDFKRKYKRFPKHKKVAAGGNVFRPEWFKPIGNLDDHEIEILHYYNKAQDLYLVVANGVMLTPNNNPLPYKHKDFPFVRAVDIIIPHSFVGMGEPKVMRCLQEERDTLRNMRLDTTHLNIQNQYIVDDRLELDDEDLIARPHGIIRGPIDSIRPLDKIPLYPESYREEQFINDDIIKATGIDIRLQALEGRKGETATEVAILKESSLKRIRLKLKLLEKMALHRLGRLRLANVQQFYSIPKIVKILGEEGRVEEKETFREIGFKHPKGGYEWFTARPEDITGEYDVVVIPGATLPVSKALEAQKRINLFDRLVGHSDIDQRELAKELIKAHDMDTEKLLTKPMPGAVSPGVPGAETPPGASSAMPPVGVGRSPASPRTASARPRTRARLAPEETLPGRAMAGGSPV